MGDATYIGAAMCPGKLLDDVIISLVIDLTSHRP